MEVQLTSGFTMPQIAFGTFEITPAKLKSTLRSAVEAGIRHFDCAAYYKNEIEIGETLSQIVSEGPVARSDLFLATKVWPTGYRNIGQACRDSLRRLQCEYLDLYLLHWPFAIKPQSDEEYPTHNLTTYEFDPIPLYQVWAEMEGLVDAGLVRSIGVSNWPIAMLIDTLSYARIKPVCNQFELQPYYAREQLATFCLKHHIVPVAYRVFADLPPTKHYPHEAKVTEDPLILALAEKYARTPAQICLNWALCKGIVVVVKSETASRIVINYQSQDFKLEPADIAQVDALPQLGSSAIAMKLFGFNIDS
jgi:diketogulonate reductase-like aldo/keto reductase